MGVAPLAAWRMTTVRRLGSAIRKPTAISLLIPIVALALGVDQWAAVLALWLTALVSCVTVYEFYRGAQARSISTGEHLIRAVWAMAARNRRRYGGYVIHLGVVFMALGIIGVEMFQTETQGSLTYGEDIALGPYVMRYDSLDQFSTEDGRVVARATVSLYKNGQPVAELHPRRDYYVRSGQPMTISGVHSTLAGDFYVMLVEWKSINSEGATFKIYLNPLVNWLWAGGIVFILGTLVAAWPDQREFHGYKLTPHPDVGVGGGVA